MRSITLLLAAMLLALLLSARLVDAKEFEYAISACSSGTTTLVSTTDDLTVLSADTKGIAWSTHPSSKAFDRSTFHCVSVTRTGRGGFSNHGYCKYMEPDGDSVVGEFQATGPEGRWQFLEGTGKYKGIQGGGPNQPFVSGKAILAGTVQGCRHASGTYTLPD